MSGSPLNVAVIGLGRMGGAMARRFSGAGHDLILWNRDRTKSERLAGDTHAAIAASAAEAAARADVVVTSLADDEALRSVYLGAAGIAAGIAPSKTAIDTSTVDPESILEVGSVLDGIDANFLDCPVSGSVSTVESGGLTVMAGGDPEVIEAVKPLLSAIAKSVIRVGPRGTGAAAKLAVNGLVHGLNIALSEALVLAEKAGISRDVAYRVFSGGAGGAPFVQYKTEAYLHPERAQVAFSLDLVAKDLALITGLARRVGAPMAQANAGLGVVNAAIARGMGDRDLSAIAVHLREGGG